VKLTPFLSGNREVLVIRVCDLRSSFYPEPVRVCLFGQADSHFQYERQDCLFSGQFEGYRSYQVKLAFI
jgi:hypothetical protein